MSEGNFRNHRTRDKRLFDNPCLKILGEPAPPPGPRDHLQPVHRGRLRLKRMLKRRHKPISDSEIKTIAHHQSQQKVGSEQRLQYSSEQFQKLMADHGVVCSMSRSGNVWDNAAMESFFSSLKTERTARKTYRTRDEVKADVFHYIERFYDAKRRHSTIGYMSPMEFELQAGLA